MATKNFGQMDLDNMVSRAQAIVASAVSTHAISLLDGDYDPSIGCQYGALVNLTVAVVGTNTSQIQVIQASDAALTADIQVIATSPEDIALSVDTPVVVEIPEGSIVASKPYLGIRYLTNATSFTVNAWIAPIKSIANNPYFPNPVTTIAEL